MTRSSGRTSGVSSILVMLACLLLGGCGAPRVAWVPVDHGTKAALTKSELQRPEVEVIQDLGIVDERSPTRIVSPDGRLLAAFDRHPSKGDRTAKRDVTLIDVASGTVLWSIPPDTRNQHVQTMCFHPDKPWCALLVEVADTTQLRVFDLAGRRLVSAHTLSGWHMDPFMLSMAFTNDGDLLAIFGQTDRSERPADGRCPSVLWIAGIEESSPRILGVSTFADFTPLSCVLAPSAAAPGSVAVYYSTSDHYALGVEYSSFRVSPTSSTCLAATTLRTTGALVSVAADGDAHTIWRDGLARDTQPTEHARLDAWVSSLKPIAGKIAFANHVLLGTPSYVWTPAGVSPASAEPDPTATTSGPEHLQWVFHRDFLADKRCLDRIRTQHAGLASLADAELARRISGDFGYQQGHRPACLVDGERLLYVPRYEQHSWDFWRADDDSFLSFKHTGRIFTDAGGELAVAPSDHTGIMVWLRRPDGTLLGGRCPSVAYIGLDSCALVGPWLCFGNAPSLGDSLEVHCYPTAALGALDAQGIGPIISPALRLSLLSPDDWVAWTPEGYHAGTPAGIRRLAWIGPPAPGGNLPEVLAAEQIAARFLRPDLLTAMWERGEAVGQVLARLGEGPGRVSLGEAIRSAPQVTMRLAPDAKETEAGEAAVHIDAVPGSEPIAEIALFHNEARIQIGDSRGLRRTASALTATIALLPGDNVLRAIALTADGVASAPVQVTIRRLAPKPKADCLILAIGIDAYLNPAMALQWAAADAQALARRIERDAGSLYRSLEVRVVPPESTTRDGLRTAFAAAAAATRPEDTFIIIYAGHGTCTAGTAGLPGQFLLVPSDMSNLAGDDELLSRQGIASDEVRDLLIAAPARRKLLIMDACNAGKAAESFARRGGGSERALQQLHRSSGIAIVAATTSDQLATEASSLGHGLFTAAALEALAHVDGRDRTVSLSSFVAFVTRRVPELAQDLKQPLQFPTYFLSGQDFPLVIVP